MCDEHTGTEVQYQTEYRRQKTEVECDGEGEGEGRRQKVKGKMFGHLVSLQTRPCKGEAPGFSP